MLNFLNLFNRKFEFFKILSTSDLAKSDVDRILKNSNFLLNKLRKLSIPIVHCYVVRKKEELKYNFSISPYIDVSQKNKLSQNKQACLFCESLFF